ncbi:PREDICTED: trefoil factor 2-like [Chrysochloris asiatica]|uniref:Trefoil factor 3 n=1 Tax=Chrysochloris asiatica TaxID=185453 RepID=A0A9B0TY84_CHRAS|nr:PREDICTED: trefoil factor 2-like [Chrysochloris asiatica]
MDARVVWLLALVLALGVSSSAGEFVGLSANQCAVPAKDRVDCGYPEVTPEQCNNRGCCFDSSISQVPWCFKPLQETGGSSGPELSPAPGIGPYVGVTDHYWGPVSLPAPCSAQFVSVPGQLLRTPDFISFLEAPPHPSLAGSSPTGLNTRIWISLGGFLHGN